MSNEILKQYLGQDDFYIEEILIKGPSDIIQNVFQLSLYSLPNNDKLFFSKRYNGTMILFKYNVVDNPNVWLVKKRKIKSILRFESKKIDERLEEMILELNATKTPDMKHSEIEIFSIFEEYPPVQFSLVELITPKLTPADAITAAIQNKNRLNNYILSGIEYSNDFFKTQKTRRVTFNSYNLT